MAEPDLRESAAAAPGQEIRAHEDGAQFDEENRLKPEFLREVRAALDAGDTGPRL